MIPLLILMLALAALFYAVLRAGKQQAKADYKRQQLASQLALTLHPAYQAAQEHDRAFLLERERLELERQREKHKQEIERREFQLKYLLSTQWRDVSQYGTVRINPDTGELMHIAPVLKPTIIKASEDQQQGMLSAGQQQPSQDYLLSQLEENSLIVSPGIRASTGQLVKVSITDVPHLKIIGSTGFGKSCLAGAILDQATQLNTPDVLQIALLDLEHKTSRLFEDLPHVAALAVGKRRVSMVATNADEVAQHLGFLKIELDRRTKLSEAELTREPVLLMYVEEMLSLQYEVVDPKLLARMFADLTILAVRGRKYGMFLLCVMQCDYSTDEMRVTQKMFRFRSAAAIDTSTARAAGFMNTDLVKQNFSQGQPGQFVVEFPAFSDIVLAPSYDVKRLVAKKSGLQSGFKDTSEQAVAPALQLVKGARNTVETSLKYSDETAWQAKVSEVQALRFQGWGKTAIIEKVWNVKAGASKAYKEACKEYDACVTQLEQEVRA